jgi:hypothetical protein
MTEPTDYVREAIDDFIMTCNTNKSIDLCYYIGMTKIINENALAILNERTKTIINERTLARLKENYLDHKSSITRNYEYCKRAMEVGTLIDENTIKQPFYNATIIDICIKRIRRYHLDICEAEDIYKMYVNWYTDEYEKIMNMPLIPVSEEIKPSLPAEDEETKPPSPSPNKIELFVENNQKFISSNEENILQAEYIHRVHHTPSKQLPTYENQKTRRIMPQIGPDDDIYWHPKVNTWNEPSHTKKYNYA